MSPNHTLSLLSLALLLGAFANCRATEPPVRFAAKVAEKDLLWPSTVELQAPHLAVQRDRCFPTAVGPYCIESDGLVPLSGVLNLVDSASRNTAGDWLIGNYPIVFFSRDGGSHDCASLNGYVERVWLGSAESGVVVATVSGSNWLSRDECRTWQRLGIDQPFGAVEASAGVLTAVALIYDPWPVHFVGYRHDLTTGETAAVPLAGPNARAALDDEGFLGIGAGLARYDRFGVQQGERTFADLEVLAACRNGPVLAASEVYRPDEFNFFCHLNAYGPDGRLWWRQEGEPGNCRIFEKGAACVDKTRLFISVAQVLLEVTREGLKLLSAPEIASTRVSSVVDGEGVRLIMGDAEGTATLAEWAPSTGWSWLGLGTNRTRNEVGLFSLGPMKLAMHFAAARNGCAGFRIAEAETGREITTVAQRCIDTAPAQIPDFHQINMPTPALVFNSAGDCQILTLDRKGEVTAFPCNPLGTFIHASVMADPVTVGRWIVSENAQFPRESLLVEDFGERVVGLGQSARFVFGADGAPLAVGRAAVAASVGAPERLGYLMVGLEEGPGGETMFTRFVPFHGPEQVWPDTEWMAGSADGFLLRTRGGMKKLVFQPEAQ